MLIITIMGIMVNNNNFNNIITHIIEVFMRIIFIRLKNNKKNEEIKLNLNYYY